MIVLYEIEKDSQKNHKYFLYFNIFEEEKLVKIHTIYLHINLAKAYILSFMTFSIKKNEVNTIAILNSNTSQIKNWVKQSLNKENKIISIIWIGWLSKPNKFYKFLVISFTNKTNIKKLIAKGLMEIRGGSVYIKK